MLLKDVSDPWCESVLSQGNKLKQPLESESESGQCNSSNWTLISHCCSQVDFYCLAINCWMEPLTLALIRSGQCLDCKNCLQNHLPTAPDHLQSTLHKQTENSDSDWSVSSQCSVQDDDQMCGGKCAPCCNLWCSSLCIWREWICWDEIFTEMIRLRSQRIQDTARSLYSYSKYVNSNSQPGSVPPSQLRIH